VTPGSRCLGPQCFEKAGLSSLGECRKTSYELVTGRDCKEAAAVVCAHSYPAETRTWMSAVGTFRTWRAKLTMSVDRGKADFPVAHSDF